MILTCTGIFGPKKSGRKDEMRGGRFRSLVRPFSGSSLVGRVAAYRRFLPAAAHGPTSISSSLCVLSQSRTSAFSRVSQRGSPAFSTSIKSSSRGARPSPFSSCRAAVLCLAERACPSCTDPPSRKTRRSVPARHPDQSIVCVG